LAARLAAPLLPDERRLRQDLPRARGGDRLGALRTGPGRAVRQLHGSLRVRAIGCLRHQPLAAPVAARTARGLKPEPTRTPRADHAPAGGVAAKQGPLFGRRLCMPVVPAANGLLDLAPSDPDALARVPSAEGVAKAVLDEGRLEALRATELLDSLDEEAFDRFTRLAAALLHAPVSLVTLLDAERAFFKSSWGLPEDEPTNREAPLTTSLCKHVVAAAAPLLIGDARLDARFQDNPLVQDETIVAYAGIPLTLSSGRTLGSFCAVDVLPRVWEENEITVLKDLGAAVVAEIEFRSAAREAARSATEARLAESLIVAENRVLSLILADAPMETVVRELEDLVRVRPLGLRARIVFTDPPDDASPPPGSPTAPASAAPSSGHAGPRAIQWSTPIRRLGGGVAGAVVSSVEGA